MSDVREVTEWHEAMEGSFTVAAEDLDDAIYDFWIATGVPTVLNKILKWMER